MLKSGATMDEIMAQRAVREKEKAASGPKEKPAASEPQISKREKVAAAEKAKQQAIAQQKVF